MTQIGTVREIHDDYILVGCGTKEGCKSCSSAFCAEGDETVFEAKNSKGLSVQPGDRVELYLATGKTIAAGFLVLIVPLLLFAAFYLIASQISTSDAVSAIAGLAGLAAGFGLSYLVSKAKRESNSPEIIAVRNPLVQAIEPQG